MVDIDMAENLFYALLINQSLIPITGTIAHTILGYKIKDRGEYTGYLRVPTKEIEEYTDKLTDPELDALDFANVACGLTHWKKTKKGQCREHAETTYDICQKLLEINGREDLKYHIDFRHSIGNKKGEGHVCLGIEKQDKWINYETYKRKKTPILKPYLKAGQIKKYSEEHFEEVQKINRKTKPEVIYKPKYHIAYPTIHGFIGKGYIERGTLALVYTALELLKKDDKTKPKFNKNY